MSAWRSARKSLTVLACVALALAAGCARESEPPLRIGTNVWIGSEPLYLARELGQLDPKVVQLSELPGEIERFAADPDVGADAQRRFRLACTAGRQGERDAREDRQTLPRAPPRAH